MLESIAEYFSANLAQNVLRGMRQNAELGKYTGGPVALGYKIDEGMHYVIDETTAPAIQTIYTMYSEGHTINEIRIKLNNSGYRTAAGKQFTYNSINTILHNKKYVGIYEFMDIIIEDAIPAIIDKETYKKVQQRLERNRRSPASAKSDVDFKLTGKLFCGKCGHNMIGDSGTSKTKTRHYYYSCSSKKRRLGCTKKSIKKDLIEELVVDTTIKQVLTDRNIEEISQQAYELYEKEKADASNLHSLQASLRDTQKTIDNIMTAIEQGIITETTKQRLMDAEERKKELQISIAKEEIKKPTITKEHIEFFLYDIRDRIHNSDEQMSLIIDTFVNAVYVYDDRITITYNFREGEELKKLELTELEKFGFSCPRFTITVLSELFMFAITIKIRS